SSGRSTRASAAPPRAGTGRTSNVELTVRRADRQGSPPPGSATVVGTGVVGAAVGDGVVAGVVGGFVGAAVAGGTQAGACGVTGAGAGVAGLVAGTVDSGTSGV